MLGRTPPPLLWRYIIYGRPLLNSDLKSYGKLEKHPRPGHLLFIELYNFSTARSTAIRQTYRRVCS